MSLRDDMISLASQISELAEKAEVPHDGSCVLRLNRKTHDDMIEWYLRELEPKSLPMQLAGFDITRGPDSMTFDFEIIPRESLPKKVKH